MAKLSQVFSGNYLKAEDLAGRNVPVVIETAEVTEFDDGKKVVLSFKGKDKKLVVNKTNASIIAEVTGQDDTDNWPGCAIVLTTKKVEFQGKLVPSIRVVLDPTLADTPQPQRRPAPQPPAPSDNDLHDSSIPF